LEAAGIKVDRVESDEEKELVPNQEEIENGVSDFEGEEDEDVKGGGKILNGGSKEEEEEVVVEKKEGETEDNEEENEQSEEVKPKKSSQKGGKKSTKSGSKTAKGKKSAKSGSKKAPTRTPREGREGRDRYFKLINSEGETYGRYTGDTPKQAASKGFTKMVQKMKSTGETIPKKMKIYLRESTRGSLRKIYGYEAARLKLPQPQKLEIKDKETGKKKVITYKYRNKIKKIQVDYEQFGGMVKAKSSKKGESKRDNKKARGTSGSKKSGSKKSQPSRKQATTKKGGDKPKKSSSARASSSK